MLRLRLKFLGVLISWHSYVAEKSVVYGLNALLGIFAAIASFKNPSMVTLRSRDRLLKSPVLGIEILRA